MSETQLSLSSIKKEFDDQLTCGVCLDQYTNPKLLPCGHIFCLKCIQQLPTKKKEGIYYINCPACRVDHLTPQEWATNLPNAFHINSLLDLQKKLATSKTIQQTPHSSETTTCTKHNMLLAVYCETCCQVICQDCTISNEHNTHNFCLISECYPKHHQQIQDSLNTVERKMADINTAATNLATRESEVLQQGQQLKEQINTHAQQIIDQVQRSRTHLSQQVDTIVQQKTQVLKEQRQQAQKLHTQLKTCQEMIEHNLKDWTQLQVLTKKHTMMDEMNIATQHVDLAVFQPIENVDMQFTEIKTAEDEIGLITSTIYKKATLKVASLCLAKQPSTATLTLQSHNGSPFSLSPSLISSTLSSPGNKHSVKCDITQTYPGKYNIKFTPSTRGEHSLMIQVGGVDVPGSPFTLPVIPSPKLRGKPLNTMTGLNRPWGIAVRDNGNIVVAEHFAHCVTILHKNGTKVKSFGTRGTMEEQFIFPRGVAISFDGYILVTDEHRLQKLTTDGVCVKSVGSGDKGRGTLEFNYPTGIAVHPTTGQIFVADCYNDRIQVFNTNLTFSHTITHTKIKGTCDVALDNEGYLYTTNCNNHCITQLTTKGEYIKRVAIIGTAPTAMYLTIHNNLVHVMEFSNNCVSIFDTTGQLLHSFGKRGSGDGEFNGPRDITTDSFGNLYISDQYNNRIVIY